MAEVIQSELSSGTMLSGGKYVIEKKIGAGGFGITYLARHTILDRKYAIKEFFMSGYNVRNNATNHVSLQGLEVKDFDRVRQTFINEARTLAHLNNEAIVKVIDIFDENGTSYMVMPFVEGTTLKSMVEKDGPMEYEMAVNYMVQICEALTYIHSKDILHRDVTPDNVIVTPEQKIVLIDFGSARKFIDNKTQRQTTIVKPGYAPLEQHSARSRKGAFTDIYSVGAVFYYLLTGERPMDATERVLEKMKEPIELNPNIPPQINAIIMKAMEMDGEMRYQSAKELIDDIFSDEPANTEKPLEEIVERKETDDQHDEAVTEETALEKQQKTMSVAPDSYQDIEDSKDITDTMTIEGARDNKESQTINEKGRNGTPLKVVAILFALIAVAAIVAVIINHANNPNPPDVPEPPKVEDPKEIEQIYQLSTGEKYVYEGETDTLGVPNGNGKATFDDRVYIGSFENGDMNGHGKLTYTSGINENIIIEGEFRSNRIEDSCLMTMPYLGSTFYGILDDELSFVNGILTDSLGNKTHYENGEEVKNKMSNKKSKR